MRGGSRENVGRTLSSMLALLLLPLGSFEIRRPSNPFLPHHICPPHIGLQLIRRSLIQGVNLGSIMARARGEGKGKAAVGGLIGGAVHVSHFLPTLPVFGPEVLLHLTGPLHSEITASL